MKLIITSIFSILALSVFAQIKVNGVEIPKNIKIIEAGVMEYKSIDKYAIIIDYGQQEGVWPPVRHYLVTDQNGQKKLFNGWVQAVNYLEQNEFELLSYVDHKTRLLEIDASKYVTFIMRRRD